LLKIVNKSIILKLNYRNRKIKVSHQNIKFIASELEDKNMTSIQDLQNQIEDIKEEKLIFESEAEALREQINILNEANNQNESTIKKLNEELKANDSGKFEDIRALEEDANKKSLLADKLFLDLSNIDKEKNDLLTQKGELSDRLSKTLDEYSAMSSKNEELMNSIKSIQEQKSQQKMENDENILHIKGTLMSFLQNCPPTNRDNESILSVVYSMLEFSPTEVKQIDATRKKNYPDTDKKNPKGGFMGMFGRK